MRVPQHNNAWREALRAIVPNDAAKAGRMVAADNIMAPPDTIGPNEIRAELASRLPKLTAQEIAELTTHFVQLAGGKYVTGKRLEKSRRNAAICTSFDGANLEELATRFNLSLRHLRRVVNGK